MFRRGHVSTSLVLVSLDKSMPKLFIRGRYIYFNEFHAYYTCCRAIMAEKGGSAVDAMIATALCEGAVDFYSSGIGGGFFMTVYDRSLVTYYSITLLSNILYNYDIILYCFCTCAVRKLFDIVGVRPRNQTTREITTLIARERAPLAATQDMYVGKPGASLTGETH